MKRGKESQVSHPLFARFYARMSSKMDKGGVVDYRRRLLAGLSGRVIEIGAGSGLNFAHYPSEVTSVLAVEPEPYLRALAVEMAGRAPVPVEVVAGVADHLPTADATCDAAVASLVLCSVPDQLSALREARRVVKPGGQLRFLEHVRADTPALRRVQHLLDATLWPRLGGGCHAGRDTAGAVEKVGFEMQNLERFRFPEIRISLPTSPHIIGVAKRR